MLFADNDLIGIPHRLVISEKTLQEKVIAYKARTEKTEQMVNLQTIMDFLQQKLTQ